jgi:hypothetical protein
MNATANVSSGGEGSIQVPVSMELQALETFDLIHWHPRCLVLPLTPKARHFQPGVPELPQDHPWFVKGHHSSKDLAFGVQPCLTLADVELHVLRSERVTQDQPGSLFAVPWLFDICGEARVFFHKKAVRWIRPVSPGGWYPLKEELPAPPAPVDLLERCCADVALLPDGAIHYLEFNPFDEDTDLYGISYWEICGDEPSKLYPDLRTT